MIKKEKYGIRKLKIGVASALIGTMFSSFNAQANEKVMTKENGEEYIVDYFIKENSASLEKADKEAVGPYRFSANSSYENIKEIKPSFDFIDTLQNYTDGQTELYSVNEFVHTRFVDKDDNEITAKSIGTSTNKTALTNYRTNSHINNDSLEYGETIYLSSYPLEKALNDAYDRVRGEIGVSETEDYTKKYVFKETVLEEEVGITKNFTINDVKLSLTPEDLQTSTFDIDYSKIPNGSRIIVIEEDRNNQYGNFAVIENSENLTDEKVVEAIKSSTTKFNLEEFNKIGNQRKGDYFVIVDKDNYGASRVNVYEAEPFSSVNFEHLVLIETPEYGRISPYELFLKNGTFESPEDLMLLLNKFKNFVSSEGTLSTTGTISNGDLKIDTDYSYVFNKNYKQHLSFLEEKGIDLKEYPYEVLTDINEIKEIYPEFSENDEMRLKYTTDPIERDIVKEEEYDEEGRLSHVVINVPKAYVVNVDKGYFNKNKNDLSLPETHRKVFEILSRDDVKIYSFSYVLPRVENYSYKTVYTPVRAYATITDKTVNHIYAERIEFKEPKITYVSNNDKDVNEKTVIENGEPTITEDNTIVNEPKDRVIEIGTKPVTIIDSIPFNTEYINNSSLPKGETRIIVNGINGETITTKTYELVDNTTGEIKENIKVETKEATTQIIEVGTGENITIPFDTIYITDSEREGGSITETTPGQNGISDVTGKVITNPIPKVITIGTKPKIIKESIPFTDLYRENSEIEAGEIKLLISGLDGEKTTTINYVVNYQTGEIKEETNIEAQWAKNSVYDVGTKPVTIVETIPFETEYIYNPNLSEGTENVITEGTNGKKTITKNYELVKSDSPEIKETITENIVEPVRKVVEIGTGKNETIPFSTIYIEDAEISVGEETILTEGQDGIKDITGKVIVEPVNKKVKVGTKAVVKEIPFEKITIEDPSKPSTYKEITTPGKNGIEMITYKVDQNTGKLIPETVVKEPITEITTIGTLKDIVKESFTLIVKIDNKVIQTSEFENITYDEFLPHLTSIVETKISEGLKHDTIDYDGNKVTVSFSTIKEETVKPIEVPKPIDKTDEPVKTETPNKPVDKTTEVINKVEVPNKTETKVVENKPNAPEQNNEVKKELPKTNDSSAFAPLLGLLGTITSFTLISKRKKDND